MESVFGNFPFTNTTYYVYTTVNATRAGMLTQSEKVASIFLNKPVKSEIKSMYCGMKVH